jgi:thiamine-phosphate pyrophosphorylase
MKLRSFPDCDIYGITASQLSLGRSNLDVVRQMLEADIKIIQYREKDFSMRQKYQECLALRDLTARNNTCFIINDDVHLALAVEADGIHVGQEDLPVEKVRELVGEKMIVGLSVSSPEQVDDAIKTGVVDYLGVGPLYPTSTKKDFQEPTGLGLLDYVVRYCQIPFAVIGGVKESNLAELAQHGATCFCMVSEIVSAPDIGAKIRVLRKQLRQQC